MRGGSSIRRPLILQMFRTSIPSTKVPGKGQTQTRFSLPFSLPNPGKMAVENHAENACNFRKSRARFARNLVSVLVAVVVVRRNSAGNGILFDDAIGNHLIESL